MHSIVLIVSYLAVFLPALAGLVWAMQRMTH
jgi:hypothetical protein